MAVLNIGKKDLLWSIFANIFKLGSGIILFPFILYKLPSETIAFWVVFTSISALAGLLDFGFKPTFARSISYIYSGSKNLMPRGYDIIEKENLNNIDFSLLKCTIKAMKYYYTRIAFIVLLALLSIGTYYIYSLLHKYNGSHWDIYISWAILCVLTSYNLYTLYFDALLTGRGNIKEYNKFVLCGNIVYLSFAAILISLGYGLVAIVSAQFLSTFIIRLLSYRCYYDKSTTDNLDNANDDKFRDVLLSIYPNAIKVGLTSIAGFITSKSAIFIGSLYLSLEVMGQYGITLQLVSIIGTLSVVYANVYMPKVFQWRIENSTDLIKKQYYKSAFVLLSIFIIIGVSVFLFGNYLLLLMKSKTEILSGTILVIMLLAQYLETNHYLASIYLLSKNEVPYFKASILSAFATLILLVILIYILDEKIWALVLAPAICQLAYQNWKWPLLVIRELK